MLPITKRDYDATGILNRRRNEILDALLHKPMEVKDLGAKIGLEYKAMRKHLQKLMADGKIQMRNSFSDRRHKVYSLVPGAMPYPDATPKPKPRRPKGSPPLKRGPKPVAKPHHDADERSISTVKAVQIGMVRDPFTAALFGTTQRASA